MFFKVYLLIKKGRKLNWINISSQYEISIKDLVKKISEIVEYER